MGSANKVISGVVDSSFGVLRALSPVIQPDGTAADADSEVQPRFTLLRRDTAFSIASLAASLPGASIRSKTPVLSHEEAGQQLVEVPSRPASIRSTRAPSSSEDDSEDEDEEGDEDNEDGVRSTSLNTEAWVQQGLTETMNTGATSKFGATLFDADSEPCVRSYIASKLTPPQSSRSSRRMRTLSQHAIRWSTSSSFFSESVHWY